MWDSLSHLDDLLVRGQYSRVMKIDSKKLIMRPDHI